MDAIAEQPQPRVMPKFSTILYGKKTVGFPMLPKDLPLFAKLHQEDTAGMMGGMSLSKMTDNEALTYADMLLKTGQVVAWVFQTKDSRAKVVGFCYLIEPKDHVTMIGGVMDKEFAKGLYKLMRKDKYTYAEDSMRAVIEHCFRVGMHRITAEVIDTNKLSQSLQRRVGFKKEGVMRKVFESPEGDFIDMVIYGLLREEYGNG